MKIDDLYKVKKKGIDDLISSGRKISTSSRST